MVQLFRYLGISIGAYVEAFPKLFRKGYRRYLALPILVYLGLLVGILYLMINNLNRWLNIALGWFGYSLGELESYSIILVILLQIFMFFFMSSLFKYATLICLSPFLSFLSEKVEKEETGLEVAFELYQLLKDLLRAIRINLLNFAKETLFTIALALLAFVPLVGLVSPFLIFLVQSYFLGYGLMDYNAERWRWSFQETDSWMRRNKGAVATVGLIFHALFLIPFLGWIFAPAWAVVAGTKVAMRLKADGSTSSPWHSA